ncbi:hypothetical protein D3C87_1494120 [compost metagenome]
MAWLLGLSGGFHSHAAPREPHRAAIGAAQAKQTIAKALPHAEEHCALCEWKASTPYAPVTGAWPGVALVVSCDRALAPVRAPPASVLDHFQGRAPPRLLSITLDT